MNTKPLGRKAYGSIPHLPGSRLGVGDYHISEGQAAIATSKPRDRHDLIIVQEKLDGSNVAVARVQGEIVALTRAGYLATSSPFLQHQFFHRWVMENEALFTALLQEQERVSGEWLAMAHGTRYALPHGPFVPFDLITGTQRLPYLQFEKRIKPSGLPLPALLHLGGSSFAVESMLHAIATSGHGALDKVEGAIWRVERSGAVDFLTKFVRHDKEDGKYFPELTGQPEVWNTDVSRWLHH